MNTVINPTTNQWIEAVADAINGLKERSVKAVKFTTTYSLEVTLTAFALLTVLFGIYALLFAPPMPPCLDN